MDRTRSIVQHVATLNEAIVVVINDILVRLAASFSVFRALSGRIFCWKIERVQPKQRNFEIVPWLGEQIWSFGVR